MAEGGAARRAAGAAPARFVAAAALVLATLVACERTPAPRPRTPAEVRAELVARMPQHVQDKPGWAGDIQSAFAALELKPTTSNLCAALAVIGQESGFVADPEVPGLAKIARAEIERRAARKHIPGFLVRAALQLEAADGRTYAQRLDAVRTERDLNQLFEELIDSVPLGRRLLGNANPVHTGGPMQVSIGWSEAQAKARPYPYPVDGSIRREVFTRRGGLYFGIAHLLAYKVSYDRKLFRFADFNAGHYASRNAAFQRAVMVASGIPLALDGDLIAGKPGKAVGATEAALQALSTQLGMDDAAIRRDLRISRHFDFEHTELYERTYEVAERAARGPLARARMPEIRLSSPKISRKLTTGWFADRVHTRYRRCLMLPGVPVAQ
jgi:hypothetical protein